MQGQGGIALWDLALTAARNPVIAMVTALLPLVYGRSACSRKPDEARKAPRLRPMISTL